MGQNTRSAVPFLLLAGRVRRFSIGESGVPKLKACIANQAKHHRTVSFEDEFRNLLRKYNTPFDERYICG